MDKVQKRYGDSVPRADNYAAGGMRTLTHKSRCLSIKEKRDMKTNTVLTVYLTLVIGGTFPIGSGPALRDTDERLDQRCFDGCEVKIALFSDARVRGREIKNIGVRCCCVHRSARLMRR